MIDSSIHRSRSRSDFWLRFLLKFVIFCLVTGLFSCATKSQKETRSTREGEPLSSFHLSDSQGPEITDEEFDAIPTEVNPLVEKWIDYFRGKGRVHMERYLSRSSRYEKLMKRVLRDNGLPEDLFYIALIESGFSARATSHASAVGYWQFIRGTGKRYGLEISRFVDERRDPVLATQAAAEYFKGLYSLFGSWYLSMASYNVGENRVKREVMKHSTRDFWKLAKKGSLPRETINYVPKFIAAKLIAKDPAKFGFEEIDYLPPVEFETIVVNRPVNLRLMAERMNLNYEDFKALNPKFKGEIAPLKDSGLDLRVPPGSKEAALIAARDSAVDRVEYVADQGETELYRIRRGDSLHSIARRYRTTVAYLRDLNDLPKGRKLRVGMKIFVPDRTPVSQRRTSVARTSTPVVESILASESRDTGEAPKTPAAELGSGASKFYVVQSGDSLFSIAQRYNTTVAELKKLNKIRRGRILKVGLKLKLPEDVAESGKPTSKGATQGRKTVKSRTHIVKKGETLTQIASKYRVSVKDLKKKNRMSQPYHLFVGARLFVPEAQASR